MVDVNHRDEVMQAISIGLIVACFLLRTNRILKSIEICKECLAIFKGKAGIKDDKLAKSLYKRVISITSTACRAINDNTNAIKYTKKILRIYRESGEKIEEYELSVNIADMYFCQSKYAEARELCESALLISTEIGDRRGEANCYVNLGVVYRSVGEYDKAREHLEKSLAINKEIGDRNGEADCYVNLGAVYRSVGEYDKAREHLEKSLAIKKEIGDRNGEADCYVNLGAVYGSVGEYDKAREHLEKSLAIKKEIGDRNGEADGYINLGAVYESVGEYDKAREHLEKSLAINKEIGDRNGEADCYVNLGAVYRSVGEYDKAREHLEKSLAINKEIGDRNGEADCYVNLGAVYRSVGEYDKAREHLEKSLAIKKEIGDRKGEADCYVNLGAVYGSVGEYDKAREHLKKSLAIKKEIGDRNGEAVCYVNLGAVYESVGEYDKAREHLEKSLAINKEIGDRNGEADCYVNLGAVYRSVGEYDKAREHLEKSLSINKEIGDRNGEAVCYVNLGAVYESVGEYDKAREHLEKSLAINKEIGDRDGEAGCYINLAAVYESVGEYDKAREHLEKSLAIKKDVGDTDGEATCYESLAVVYQSVGEENNAIEYLKKALVITRKNGRKEGVFHCCLNLAVSFGSLGRYPKAIEYIKEALIIASQTGYRAGKANSLLMHGCILHSIGGYAVKVKEYCREAIAISKEIGLRETQVSCYLILGHILFEEGEYDKAEDHYKKSLAISENIGDILGHFRSLQGLARVRIKEGKNQEATSYLLTAIEKCEKMRGSLRDNDQWKISFMDANMSSYHNLSRLLWQTGNREPALYVSELGKARALADLMTAQYSVNNQLSANPQTWFGIESFMDRERNCSCLHVSYSLDTIYFWILKRSELAQSRDFKGKELFAYDRRVKNLDAFFATKSFRSFGMSTMELRKDDSLNVMQGKYNSCKYDSHEGFRLGNESKENQGPKMNLPLCYKLIIAPVADLLDGSEIIIVPDRSLYNIPFAALPDESGKTLSETFKIRVAPSLTTLRLIHDSPADYHSQTGALIVGNPDVGEVIFKGRRMSISRLPCAEEEAKMVGKKLGVEPLLGEQATKQAVLKGMESVALIHLAAHGDAGKGEIALAPSFRIPNGIPREGLYLLTTSDISKVQVRAKLVVLSCCHSARGEIKAEGAVGIARAFLGSGARSVLVSLWALEDSATEKLMSHFYDHLVRGESASDSLHQAMTWMRCNGYSDVKQWAPFVLIGDNVTFNFGK